MYESYIIHSSYNIHLSTSRYQSEKYLQKTNDRIAINLIRMFRLGPDVSFIGSPTVSPITAALWISLPFFATTPLSNTNPASIYFLALSQAPPVLE